MALPYTRAEVKERAKSTWHGMCNVSIASMTSDFKGLNARAIEHDVKLAAEHGFWGTLIASESGLTTDEYIAFMEIAAGAAPKDFRLVTHFSFDTPADVLRVAKAAEALGYEAALVNYPDWFRPKTPAGIVNFTREIADQTDLALILFAVPTWGFKALHPSAFPPDALAEMARFQTAAALKYEANPPAMNTGFADIRRRCGEHVIVECPLEHYAPGLVDAYGMQWMGTSSYESYGDRVPQWFKLLHEGKWDEGMALYWKCQPARDAKSAYHASFGGANLISRVGWKYMSWLQGYSGGMLRMPHHRILPNQMRALRTGFAASGYTLPESDDDFYAGRFPTDVAYTDAVLAGTRA
jgi:dihydrodipicolinate synthase/N-acetylneuraminate lyase